MAVIKRMDREHYINIGTQASPVWSRVGEGFTEFTESKNPVSTQRRYIHEATKRTDVTGYAPEIDYEFELFGANAAADILRTVSDNELTGDDAKIELLTVNRFEETETSGVYRAYLREYAVVPDECGSGTDALLYTGTLKACGEITGGEFVESTKTFRADA